MAGLAGDVGGEPSVLCLAALLLRRLLQAFSTKANIPRSPLSRQYSAHRWIGPRPRSRPSWLSLNRRIALRENACTCASSSPRQILLFRARWVSPLAINVRASANNAAHVRVASSLVVRTWRNRSEFSSRSSLDHRIEDRLHLSRFVSLNAHGFLLFSCMKASMEKPRRPSQVSRPLFLMS